MKYFILASLLAAITYGGSLHRTGSSIPSGHANKKDAHDGDSYEKENYAEDSYKKGYGEESYHDDGSLYENEGYKEPKCYPVYETMYKEQCENYHEKVCYSVQEEQCQDVMGKKCQAIKTSKQERKCHYVNELLCSLKQTVQYEEVPAVFTVQKCHTAIERVCDTVYDTVLTERDDFQCIEVVNPYCTVKEHTVYDKTCRTVTHFDCKSDDYSNHVGYGDSYKSKEYSGDDKSVHEGSEEYSKYPNHYCKKSYETKCYSTPRTVSTEHCEDRKEKVCEKLTEKVPIPSEKQNCHDEKKKVCELEQRSQPKQVKKYVYTKHCRPVPKTVCDNADQMYLTPSCVPKSWKKCSFYPKEKCEDIPKKHCYQVPYQIEKMHCPKGYGADYVKPHAYKDDQYQHDSYKQDPVDVMGPADKMDIP